METTESGRRGFIYRFCISEDVVIQLRLLLIPSGNQKMARIAERNVEEVLESNARRPI
jgi:hypothetical protein